MAVRRESVRLELIDNGFSTSMAKNAAATMLLEKALKSLDGTSVVVHQRISESATQVDRLSKSSHDANRSINQLTGRLELLADAVAILGPGFVPIAAVAVPAVSGLAAQLGFALTGAAGFAVAVQGMGDALGAMNDARLEPTTENLAKARLEMEKMSPAGQDLIRQLVGLRDEWKRLRDSAQGALFSGLSLAITDLESRLPDIERILGNVNRAVGEMLGDGAESLASPRWDEFFTFIATDAPPAIASMGRALGSVTHAMTELWRAFDPLNDDFSVWIEDAAASFDKWASGLSRTEGLQEFVDYIRETGPQVAETLGAVALAVVRIGEAAAPLGGPVLAALEGVADAIAAIAGSDAGPAIMATVTALALLRRGMSLFDRGSQVAWVQSVKGAEGFGQKVAAARSPLLRTTAAMGGLALASSGVADGILGSNIAIGAMQGSLAGPWGAAVGAAVGLMLDLSSSIGGFEISADSLTATLNQQTGAITENTTAFAANELEKQGVLKAAQSLGLSLADVTQASLGNADALARVNAGLDAAKEGFYNADGSIAVSSNTLTEYGEKSFMVTDAIGIMSGELEAGQTRVRRMADATSAGAASMERAKTAAQDFADAVTNLNNVLERRATVRDYEAAVDDLAASIKENGRNFDVTTEKGRTNQAALDNVATTAIRLAENLKGAARQRVLTAAIADLREAGNKFDIPKAEVQRLIELLRKANAANVNPTIKVNTNPAMNDIDALEGRLRAIKDEDVFINVRQIGSTTLGPRNEFYSGGFTGHGGKYEPAGVVHRGEVVLPQEVVRTDWSFLKARYGYLPGFAEGGVVGKDKRNSGAAFYAPDNTTALQAAIDRLTMVAQDQTAAVEDATRRTDEWSQRIADVAKATVSGFNTGLFERGSSPWGSGAAGGPIGNLLRDIAGLEQRGALQNQLAGLGLSEDALAELLRQAEGVQGNAQIAALIQSGQVSQYAALFNQRAALQGSVGAAAGQQAYGAQMQAADKITQVLSADLRRTEAQLLKQGGQLAQMQAALTEIARNGPERAGSAFGKALDGVAAGAHRDRANRTGARRG
jgi:hypothetical protein